MHALRLIGFLFAFAAPAALAQFAWDKSEWPKTDFSRRTVELAEIQSGGPPKDGIPAIDRPKFVSPQLARTWLGAREPVIALRLEGEARAYPLQVLMFHEIVNDLVRAVPVTVTFCPLCNASIVFDRRVGPEVLDFGTTGRLRKSDLVMYDRQTESWWQQFTGKGIVGRYAGTTLRRIPSEIVSFEEFATAYPRGKVLSRAAGRVSALDAPGPLRSDLKVRAVFDERAVVGQRRRESALVSRLVGFVAWLEIQGD